MPGIDMDRFARGESAGRIAGPGMGYPCIG